MDDARECQFIAWKPMRDFITNDPPELLRARTITTSQMSEKFRSSFGRAGGSLNRRRRFLAIFHASLALKRISRSSPLQVVSSIDRRLVFCRMKHRASCEKSVLARCFLTARRSQDCAKYFVRTISCEFLRGLTRNYALMSRENKV